MKKNEIFGVKVKFMKKMVCDLCESTEFVKSDGFFECQSCHTKYTEEDAKKLLKEVKNKRFEEKLAQADDLAKKFFSSSNPDVIVYKNAKGIDAVMKCYEEAKSEDDTEPDYYLHAADFYVKASIEYKEGKRIKNNTNNTAILINQYLGFYDKAKEYAKKNNLGDDKLYEIERQKETAEKLIKEKVPKLQKKGTVKGIIIFLLIIGAFIAFGLTIGNIINPGTKYYVAKLPQYNAATVQVDGYIHKSKSCCQKVADKFDAEVIEIKLKDVAGYTEYGQAVTYEKAFKRCPYCYD